MTKSTNQFIRGTLILSAAVMISKVLGLIYLIPLKHIIDYEGINLLMTGYIPYTVILSLATMGIPIAVSKYVSKYNSLGQYRKGKQLLRSTFFLLITTGPIAAIVVFLLAPYMAYFLRDPEAVWPIRAVSTALVIVPAMAVVRGYFQGWQSMGPTAVSQVIEQLIRVLFILGVALLMIHLGYSLSVTVAVASLGAFLGAGAGMVVLLLFWYKRRGAIHEKVLATPYEQPEPFPSMFRELIRYAIPISFISLAIPLFQLVDWSVYKQLLMAVGYTGETVREWFAILTGTAHKVMMIPVSLATAFALAILPTVTHSHAKRELDVLREKINDGVSILLYFMIPASIGIFVLAEPLYYVIYNDLAGVGMLKWYASSAVCIALFTFTAAILQGINQMKWSVMLLLIALGSKAIATPLFLWLFHENGAVMATTVGFFIGAAGNIWRIQRVTAWENRATLLTVGRMAMFAGVMGLVVLGMEWLFVGAGWNERFLHYLTRLGVGVLTGVLIYIGLTWRMPYVHFIIGRWTRK